MHIPALILDLATILGVAAVVTFIFRRIKQPVVLGYIIAGIIVGPFTPALISIRDLQNIHVWADLGVIFLMFTLGLEFSFRRLARVGMSAAVTALIQIAAMVFLGLGVGRMLGWKHMDSVFLGCMIGISSTTIIIKTLDELGLKSKKFAELVFGILIVEDLAAILMLVALTNIARTSEIGGVELLLAGGKLLLMVGLWFVVGMFMVPRGVRLFSRHGNDELLTVMAVSLCLALVAFAAYFQYSVALGAFIMGSIIAESSEARRIEHLVAPLKDIFGAVFFVSVGMLLDPHAIASNYRAVLLIVGVIIVGKLASVTFGAFVSGQSLRTAVQTGCSMAQIGEFSFIIASLGLTYGVIAKTLYPIIVAASLATTFTTPYLIQASAGIASFLERQIPPRLQRYFDRYVSLLRRLSLGMDARQALLRGSLQWGLNAVVVITLFTLAADLLVPLADQYLGSRFAARGASWFLAFILAAPCMWGMLFAFRNFPSLSGRRNRARPLGLILLLSRLCTVGIVGLMSLAFFPRSVTLVLMVVACTLLFLAFRRQLGSYYHWFELQFQMGFQAESHLGNGASDTGHNLDRLAPWDAHLVEVKVPARSFLVGRTLLALKLRETYGLNVVVIIRDQQNIVAPGAGEFLFPGDRLLVFATDSEIERFRESLVPHDKDHYPHDLDGFDIRCLVIEGDSPLLGLTIRESGIHEHFGCIVVGLERGGNRLRSPNSDLVFTLGDVLWVVGERSNLQKL